MATHQIVDRSSFKNKDFQLAVGSLLINSSRKKLNAILNKSCRVIIHSIIKDSINSVGSPFYSIITVPVF